MCKRMSWTPTSYHIYKLTKNGPNLNIRVKTIRSLKENLDVTIHEFRLGNGFLDMAQSQAYFVEILITI